MSGYLVDRKNSQQPLEFKEFCYLQGEEGQSLIQLRKISNLHNGTAGDMTKYRAHTCSWSGVFSVEPHNLQKPGELDRRKGCKRHKICTKIWHTICKTSPISSLSTFQDTINVYLSTMPNKSWAEQKRYCCQ